jgi:hypothetical protein
MGRADVAADRVAGLQVEFSNLRGGDVDVIGTGQIVVIGRAEESVAIGQDFENAIGEDVSFFFALGLKDFEDQVLFAEAAGTGDVEGARNAAELRNVFFFQFRYGHDHLRKEVSGGPERGKYSRSNRRGLKSCGR